MFKGLEHPSAFPSMLRGSAADSRQQSQSQIDVRQTNTNYLSKRDSYGSTATINPITTPLNNIASNLRRRQSFGSNTLRRDSYGTGVTRRDSFGSTTLNRRDSFGSNTIINNNLNNQRRDSFGSTLSRGDSLDLKVTKRDSFSGGSDLRRQSFGSSLYLRPDSSGNTNLIRRDSFGSQNLRKDSSAINNLHRTSMPRDYVSKPADNVCNIKIHNTINDMFNGVSPSVAATPKKETNSILRKESWKSSNKHVSYNEVNGDDDTTSKNNKENNNKDVPAVIPGHKLTAANLTKHVTILEGNLKNNVSKKLSFDEDNLSNYSRDRKNSSGSIGSYLASRRISIDSLETRRNSWDRNVALNGRRGSQSSSTDFDITKEHDKEVSFILGT